MSGDETSGRLAEDNNALRLAAVQLNYVPNIATVQGNYWLPDEPLVEPALLWSAPTDLQSISLADREFQEDVRSRTEDILQSSRRANSRSFELKLKQILDFCLQYEVDIAVFPECSVPVNLVSVLLGFRQKLSVFAGIGRIRDRDIALLRNQGFSITDEISGCNAAVFTSADDLILVTKRDRAANEFFTLGSGLQRRTISKGSRRYELGLGICMDYVNARRDFDGGPQPPHVVLVSALTKTTGEFLKRPRNFATVFANHALHGGSAILAPAMSGNFVDIDGTTPLPAGEGLVVADYAGFPTRPSGTQPPSNRIVLRSALLYEELQDADISGTPSGLARPMAKWALKEYTKGGYAEYLNTAEERLSQVTDNDILLSAVRLLRRRQHTETLLEPDFKTLTTHLILTGVNSEAELRYAALGKLQEAWRPFLDDPRVEGLGALIDEVNAWRRRLEGRVRLQHRDKARTSGGHFGSGTPGAKMPGSAEFTTFYSARLGFYDIKQAVESLPRQLGVLRTLSRVDDRTVRLLYRISTARQTSGNLAPFFDVLGVTESTDAAVFEDLAEGVGQQLGVAYSGAWDISSSSAPVLPSLGHIAQLRMADGHVPTIQEDWGSLIDYLRALKPQVAVQMSCLQVEAVKRDATVPHSADSGFFAAEDRDASAFLARAGAEEDPTTANLGLYVHVASDEALPDSVLRSIGLWLFRSLAFEIVRGNEAQEPLTPGRSARNTTPLTPAEVLRIFHPPYGRIEARGLPRHNKHRDYPLPATMLPTGGLWLGTARTADARQDRPVEVRMDAESRLRHTYLIGRTGSGKTNLLKLMARQDIREGRGVAVIDPHGDLVDYLLGHVENRADDVLLLDFGDPDYLPVLNPLDLDVNNSAERELAIEEFIQLLGRQSFHEHYGPRFEEIVRLALESVTNEEFPFRPPSVIDSLRVLRSKKRRDWIRGSILKDRDLVERWDVFEQQGINEIGQVLHWALSKFSEMQQDGVLGNVLAGGRSTVSLNQCVQNGGVLLVKLPEWEMSRSGASFLGAFIQERIRKAVYGRWRQHGPGLPFYLYVDEFQFFAVTGFDELVAEARKFGLALTLAHQNLSQLEAFSRHTGSPSPRLLDTVLGNVGNRVVFGVSSRDAQRLAPDLDMPAESLRSPGQYQAITQILMNGEPETFTLLVPSADADRGLPDHREATKQKMIASGRWRLRKTLREEDEERERRMQEALVNYTPPFSLPRRPSTSSPSLPPPPVREPSRQPSSPLLDKWRQAMSEPAGGSPRDIPSQRGNEREAEDPVGDDELAAPDSGGTGTPRSASSDAAAENDQVDVVGDVSDYEIKLDVGTLRDMGLADLPETRHSNIFRMLYDELEMRVGTALAEQMSDVQLEEFEAFIDANDETGGLRWLQQNFPAYRETVRNEFAKLSAEVRGIANAILHITAEMMPADEATDPTADQSTVADLVTDAGTRAIDGMFGNPSKAGAIADDTSDDGGDAQPETHGGAQ